jgi:hypothetical protein
MAAAIEHKPRSLQFIRQATGLTLSGEEFRATFRVWIGATVSLGDRAKASTLLFALIERPAKPPGH